MINGVAHGGQRGTTVCQLAMRFFKDGDKITLEPWRAHAFPVIRDLMVNRSAFDRIIQAGGYISAPTGSAPAANSILVPKEDADTAMDAATCIGCGACVAACPNGAAQLFTAGLDAARSTPDRFTILISLYDLGLASQARGDLDGARGLLRQGLSLAAEAGDESAAAYYLEALAAIARQQDDPQRAAWLLAAAGAQLQASGSGWLHAYVPRAPHDHSVEAELRARMGDAAYEQAAAHGRSLTGARGIQQGLAEAQRDSQRREGPA